MAFDKEAYVLKLLKQSGVTRGIGDDCCILSDVFFTSHISHVNINPTVKKKKNQNALVIGMDSFCEGVHFLQEWFSPYDIAYKAFMINYSDIVAMNATPAYALVSLTIPRLWEKDKINSLVSGMIDFAKVHKIYIIGGDTISAQNLSLHITMLAYAKKHSIYRDNIMPGSHLYCTSDMYPKYTITRSFKMLNYLLNSARHTLKKQIQNKPMYRAKGRFLCPKVRAAFIRDCAHFIRGGMDISDGLGSDIVKLCTLNHLHFHPSLSFRSNQRLFFSGEEYEMLLAIAPKDVLRLKRHALKHRIQLKKLGVLRRQSYYRLPPRKVWH